QNNTPIAITGTDVKAAVCAATNYTRRGQLMHTNNAIIVTVKKAIQPFIEAFENYWENDFVKGFGPTDSTDWHSLEFSDIDAKVTFSPHSKDEGVLQSVAEDIVGANSSVFYSLAFLNQTGGAVTDAIKEITKK